MQSNMSIQTVNFFAEKYKEAYTKQIDALKGLLVEQETGRGKFAVVGIEAGLGKSTETDNIIAEYLNVNGLWGRKFLLVKKFKEEVARSVERINSQCTNLPAAVGITYENWAEHSENLDQLLVWPVIVITHSRYMRLCQDAKVWQFFQQGRHTLIIDEQLEVPVRSFSVNVEETLHEYLPSHTFWPIYYQIYQQLYTEVARVKQIRKNNCLIEAVPQVDIEVVQEFQEAVSVNGPHFASSEARNKVFVFIDFLKAIEDGICLYNNQRLTVLSGTTKRLSLSNNIILDANASIDRRYKYAKDMTVVEMPRIIDHSNTTFHAIEFNTSRSNIQKHEEYYPVVSKLIKESKGPGDKTLIIGHERHEDTLLSCLKDVGFKAIGQGKSYNGEDIAVAHFGEILGRNYWRDFTQIWVIASPILPMEIYPLHWSYFAQEPLRDKNLAMHGIPNKYYFMDEVLEDIRLGCIVSDIYQAVKRINRDGTKKAEMFVINGELNVIDEVKAQLKNVKTGETIVLPVEDKKDRTAPKRKTKVDELVELLHSLESGTYKKSELYKQLGWNSTSQASRYWRDLRVKELETAGLIKIEHSCVIVFARLAA